MMICDDMYRIVYQWHAEMCVFFSQNLRFFSGFTCETFVKQTNCDGGCVVVVVFVLFALLFWIGS